MIRRRSVCALIGAACSSELLHFRAISEADMSQQGQHPDLSLFAVSSGRAVSAGGIQTALRQA